MRITTNEKPIKLIGLKSSEYEHPLDRESLDKLQGIPALPSLTKKLLEISYEKAIRIQYTGSNLRVTDKNLPKVYEILAKACEILDISKVPELFIQWDHSVNAFTTGVENPFIVINSGCIDLLEDQELLFILGHELGHIKSGHVLYRTLAKLFPELVEQFSQITLGIGGIAGTAVQASLMNWYRMSEFTADRAGLLTCQDKKTCIKSMVKLAGLPSTYRYEDFEESFIQQAKEFINFDNDSLDQAVKFFSTLTTSHPWTVMRAAEFLNWIETGEYETILKKDRNETSSAQYTGRYCLKCGEKISKTDSFCGLCGAKLKT